MMVINWEWKIHWSIHFIRFFIDAPEVFTKTVGLKVNTNLNDNYLSMMYDFTEQQALWVRFPPCFIVGLQRVGGMFPNFDIKNIKNRGKIVCYDVYK